MRCALKIHNPSGAKLRWVMGVHVHPLVFRNVKTPIRSEATLSYGGARTSISI